jgi:4-amino-4-deoxy-L-arabinose transferase-like glycosyltransferase
VVALLGLAARILVAALPGNAPRTPWGGGGDTTAYLLLAHNLAGGAGYAYAGMPTALRAPLYPLVLASAFRLFGDRAPMAIRWLQFFEGLAVAFLCAALARKIFGGPVWKFAFAFALFSPTLLEMNGELLTEATATLFAALFLLLLAEYWLRPRLSLLAALGCVVGFASLTRFNMALLIVVALGVVLFRTGAPLRLKGAAVLAVVSLGIVGPWLIRNYNVFHGEALFSTHGGLDALEGVLTPQGRALPGDAQTLRAAVGWVPPIDVETNSASRRALPAEPVLERQCWQATAAAWRRLGWKVIPVEVRKLLDFWLSTDQLLSTGSFTPWGRIERAAGVLVGWGILGTAILGWFRLRERNSPLARVFLLYAVLVTAMHLPFVMNTRLRMPFVDPLLAALAGIGALTLISPDAPGQETILPNPAAE